MLFRSAKEKLKLPVQLGYPQGIDGLVDKVDDPAFATVIGLIFWALEMQEGKKEGRILVGRKASGSGIFEKIKKLFRIFLP